MNDTLRYIIAGVLIFFIILLQPVYLKWLGYDNTDTNPSTSTERAMPAVNENLRVNSENKHIEIKKSAATKTSTHEQKITIVTPLYTTTISNRSGGSIVSYELTRIEYNDYKYFGGYDDSGEYNNNMPVSMILSNTNACQPCLGTYNANEGKYNYLNNVFDMSTNMPALDTVRLDGDKSIKLDFLMRDELGRIVVRKSTVFYGDSFISEHTFSINDAMFYENNIELIWTGGLRPTEQVESEDVQYGSGIISQGGEIEDIQINSKDMVMDRAVYQGSTDWAAIRTKYFITALMPNAPSTFAMLSAENIAFGERKQTPLYYTSLGFSSSGSIVENISSKIYLGPLDVDYIGQAHAGLDATMNWGWAIIRPISKGILWVLKFMHHSLHLNYGLSLLLFALLIRLITGPLTKKSYESTQKMQKIQPQIKKMQEKYQKDPQRLNKEMMGMYKKHGVNPLGGCLPMLLQMPLLMALFIVFRTTIEFRGQPFFFWITDLSKPDVIFNLPFSIPVYGSGVAVLPLIMGLTLFMTMQMSSATMDKNQKPIMYFMNGFFILLFNSFPSGLNLYYTAYNLLNFMQQRSIRNKLDG